MRATFASTSLLLPLTAFAGQVFAHSHTRHLDNRAAARQLLRREEGTATPGSTPQDAISAYKCDPSKCQLPNCRCVSRGVKVVARGGGEGAPLRLFLSPALSIAQTHSFEFLSDTIFYRTGSAGQHGCAGRSQACEWNPVVGLTTLALSSLLQRSVLRSVRRGSC